MNEFLYTYVNSFRTEDLRITRNEFLVIIIIIIIIFPFFKMQLLKNGLTDFHDFLHMS